MKKLTLYILLFISAFFTFSNAQNNINSETTANIPFQKEFDEFDVLVQDKKFDQAINSMLKVTKSKNQLELVVAYSNLADAYLQKKNYDLSNLYLNKVKTIVEESKTKLDDAYYYQLKGRLFYRKDQNEDAIKNLFESIKILQNIPDQDIMLGYSYYYLTVIQSKVRIYSEDYKKYVNKNLEYALKTNNLQLMILSYIEQSLFHEVAYNKFQKKEDLDLIYESSNKLIGLINQNKNKGVISNRTIVSAYNNLATFINNYPYKGYSKIEKAKIAEKEILKGIEVAKQARPNSEILGYCYLTYGEIQHSLGNYKQTEEYYLKAKDLVFKSSEANSLYFRKIIAGFLADLYKSENKMNLAFSYKEEEYKNAKLSYEQALDDKKKYLEAYYNMEQKNLEIQQLEETNSIYSKQKFLYIGIIALAISGLIFLIYLINYKQKINKQKTDLLESEKIETQLKLQLEIEEKARLHAEKELNNLQQEKIQKAALATSLQLDKKNSFINELKEKAKDENNHNLHRILKDERLLDEDFNEVKNIAQDLHPNFFKKMNEISKMKLTNLDLKYAAYIYLGMDNLQIANLMKVEPKTVRMTKYRMKQKIGLEKDVDLTKFLKALEL